VRCAIYDLTRAGVHSTPSRAALNAADNFQIRYYADEAAYTAAPDKPKGSIHLCWYRVER
jgi:hypothetical protein